MRRFLAVLAPLLLIAGSLTAWSPPRPPPVRIIEDFSGSPVGRFPKNFRSWPLERHKAVRVYRVSSEPGNRYLEAYDAEQISAQIFRKFYWNPRSYPVLNWRWRARTLPAGADERVPQKNDSACGVYVVFGGWSGKSVKYVWSARVPAGAVIPKRKGKSFSIVKNSGRGRGWQAVSVNVVEDYRRLFGEEPGQDPIGIGLLTDGNATRSPAACDYDDFILATSASPGR